MTSIDNNRNYIALASQDIASATPAFLKVDPSTGRLLMVLAGSVSGSPTVHTSLASRDDNREVIALCTGDDGTAAIIPLHVSNGYLAVDVLEE
jgi:hypothetical protein